MLENSSDLDDFVFPFEVLALLEWKKPQGSEYFRFVHFDRAVKRFYVMPMGRKPTTPDDDCGIEFWTYERVAHLLGTVICQVPEFVRLWFMSEKVELTKREAKEISRRRKILIPVLNGELALTLGYDIKPADVYTDESLRESLFVEQEKRTRNRKDFVRGLFNSRVWFGGGDRSIMPLYRLRGAPGVSRYSTKKRKLCKLRVLKMEVGDARKE